MQRQVIMTGRWFLLLPVLALATFMACGKDDGQANVPGSSSEPTTPGPVRTPAASIAEADAVVREVLGQDRAALVAMTSYTTVRCISEPQGAGAPPLCSRLGVPEGTFVETLPLIVSEAEYRPRADVPALFQEWLGEYALVFVGVLKPARHPLGFSTDADWPVPDYAVIFRPSRFPARRGVPDPDLAFGFYLLNGRIIAVQGFGIGAATLPAPDDPLWLVPPQR